MQIKAGFELSRAEKVIRLLVLPLNISAAAFELLCCTPIIGRMLKWLWNSLLSVIHLAFGILEIAADKIGFRPTKKLRYFIVILSDEDNLPLEKPIKVIEAINRTKQIFSTQANIDLIPAFPPWIDPTRLTGESKEGIFVLDYKSSRQILDLGCGVHAILNDLLLQGSTFQWIDVYHFFYTGFRRFFGCGVPVTIYIVRNISKKIGCSLGWLSDYVTIKKGHLKAIPHELGHACNLLHRNDPHNLMYPIGLTSEDLSPWQTALLRASRHVTIW